MAESRVWRERRVFENDGGSEAGERPKKAAADSSKEGRDRGGAQASVGVRDERSVHHISNMGDGGESEGGRW